VILKLQILIPLAPFFKFFSRREVWIFIERNIKNVDQFVKEIRIIPTSIVALFIDPFFKD